MLQLEIITEGKELASICELYWEVDSNLNFVHKVSELAELSKIEKAKLTTVIREACNAYVSDWKCADCERPFVFSSRSDFTGNRSYLLDESYRQHSFLCSDCKKKRREKEIEEKKRQEEAARRARDAVETELRKKIQETYDLSNRQPINIQSLTLTDALYLISMMRGGAYENLTKIMPVSMFEQPVSADQDFTTEIINHLYERGLIYVHPDTEPEAFVNDDISRFYIYRVYYAPPISQSAPDDSKMLMTELLNLVNNTWSDEWCQEALVLWKKVALSECKEYLLFVLNEHHLNLAQAKKQRNI